MLGFGKRNSSSQRSVDAEPDTHDYASSEEAGLVDERKEKRFVRKLDWILVTWAFFAYLLKMIDGTNYKTAYASGMKEELNMTGNELNFLDIYYRIGYAIFLLPCQIILTKVRPNWWLPSMEMAWGLMTALMAAAHDVRMMYALRFFIGVFEASSYPGIISILCNWYTPREVGARIVIFSASYPVSAMFVSAMQASLSKTLDGRSGLSGWRWL
jgi:sugar phosphate permease